MRQALVLFTALFGSLPAVAWDVIQAYEEARDTYFWDVLYKDGGEILYEATPSPRAQA